ncbi:hypothetical protein QUF64_00335 [Anaerolineales bacterium HSG6]|nr:hypothetical protein [Anaerolineales bacterium HSG6]
MYQIIEGSTQNLPDVEEFLETLTLLEQNPIPQARTLFDPQADDPRWGGYLANVTSSEFEKHYRANLPETIQGDQFLERYWGTTDSVTQVDPRREYFVRTPTAHPIYENFRVQAFAQLLKKPVTKAKLQYPTRFLASTKYKNI